MIAMYYSRDHSKVYIYKYLEHTETGNRSHPWDDSGGGGHSLFLLNTANLKDPSSGNWQVGSYINFKQQLKPVRFLFYFFIA